MANCCTSTAGTCWLFLLFCCWSTTSFGTHGFLAMRHKRQEIRKVNAELDRLNKENAKTKKIFKDLKTDPQTIRKIAREELGFAQPGEIIIKLPAPEQPAPAAAKP